MDTLKEILREDLREQFEIPYPPTKRTFIADMSCKRCKRECGYCADIRAHRETRAVND